ncbi:hypothetical protein RJT34_12455 [Clitoria ternatea]|uniref:Uncharacterized protein n=1 Tax=Clitoria ternatea TaxID=43366 RepID=A0AAN9JPH0_CLITE
MVLLGLTCWKLMLCQRGRLEARGEEVKQLRQVVEDKEEKIREMEVGMIEKNSEKEWELMGTKLLVEQMKEETTRRDEADLEENDVKTLVGKQSGKGIVKLEGNITLPESKQDHRNGMTLKVDIKGDGRVVDIKGDGRVVVLNTQNLPLVGEVGLGADLVRLDGKAIVLLDFPVILLCRLLTLSGVVVGFRLLELMAEGFWRLL